MRQPRSNPGGITLVSFLARPLLHLVAIGHPYLDRFTQDTLTRLPVDARTLQGHHRTLRRLPPGAKSDKFTVSGTTLDQLCGALAIITDPT
jgi:hypothetical protein